MDHHHAEEHGNEHGPDASAQEALQFLALAAGIVLLLRLVVLAFDQWTGQATGGSAQAMAPFRNGYPLVGADVVVCGGMAIAPRMAVGLLFVLLSGVGLALVAWPIGRLFGWSGPRSAVVGSRAGLLLGMAWTVYCLLCLPPRITRITDAGIEQLERTAFLGTIPLPIPGRTTHWSNTMIDRFAVDRTVLGNGTTGHSVVIHSGEAVVPIAWHMEQEGDRNGVELRQRAEAEQLASALQGALHQP